MKAGVKGMGSKVVKKVNSTGSNQDLTSRAWKRSRYSLFQWLPSSKKGSIIVSLKYIITSKKFD